MADRTVSMFAPCASFRLIARHGHHGNSTYHRVFAFWPRMTDQMRLHMAIFAQRRTLNLPISQTLGGRWGGAGIGNRESAGGNRHRPGASAISPCTEAARTAVSTATGSSSPEGEVIISWDPHGIADRHHQQEDGLVFLALFAARQEEPGRLPVRLGLGMGKRKEPCPVNKKRTTTKTWRR